MTHKHLIQWGRALLLGTALALLPACSSTQIQSKVQPAGTTAIPFRNIMVAGVDQRPGVRDPFENDAAAFLDEHGVKASPSHDLLSFADLKGDKEQLRQKLVAAHVESLLFVRVTSRNDEYVQSPPIALGSMDMGGVDESVYNAFTSPGAEINTAFSIGARLYRVSDGAVIWSAVLNTIMKEDADALAFERKLAKDIVDQMAKDKVIP